MRWFVNDRTMNRSTMFHTKKQARHVAKQLTNASISKGMPKPFHRRRGHGVLITMAVVMTAIAYLFLKVLG